MKTVAAILVLVSSILAPAQTIVCASGAPANVQLAAKEIRRYVYLRTGELMPVLHDRSDRPDWIRLAVDAALGPQQYRLKTTGNVLTITGGSDIGVLYGAYRYAELLGVRFYLHGDVVPDERLKDLPAVEEETGKPLFALRGINPWGTHVYGFEQWEADGFKAVISQLAKMRMNFIGMHTYSECGWGSEPTVWLGMPEDMDAAGNPTFSYPSFYFNTERNVGGQAPRRTGLYGYGGHLLFETDEWGVSVMKGNMPVGRTMAGKNEVFVRTGRLLREAFEHAHRLGVKTALGTEIPLTDPARLLPHELRARLKELGKSANDPEVLKELYRGTFLRAMKTYPLDYYWLWTPEAWRTPQAADAVNRSRDDLLAAVQAAKEARAPFALATAGWVLGPSSDRTMFDRILPKDMPFAALNRELGTVPVEAGFKDLKGRAAWAIPWLEDDLSSNSPQLWVGRVRRDAYDALRYGCTGLMGLHWRTDEVSPMVGALAQAQWQAPAVASNEAAPAEITAHGGAVAHFTTPQQDTDLDPIYQSVRYDLRGYDFAVPDGTYKVILQFNEPYFNAARQRVFGVVVQGRTVIEELDVFARAGKDRALDYTFDGIVVRNGKLTVEFLTDISQGLMEGDRKVQKTHYVSLPCIAGIVLDGPRKLKLNCGGPAWRDYVADPGPQPIPRYLPTEDFYHDWALHQFGPEAAGKIADLFARMDGRLPTPAPGCPGIIAPNGKPWSAVKADYSFVDELAGLRSQIVGQGNQARFDFWLKSFEYLRAIGKAGCGCGALGQAMQQLARQKSQLDKKSYARQHVLPIRVQLNQDWGRMVTLAMETAGSWGGIGHVIGHEATNRGLLEQHDPAIEEALGTPLPAEALPWRDYRGQPRMIVLTPRGDRVKAEALTLKVMILDHGKPQPAVLRWRTLGAGPWHEVPLQPIARAVHAVTLPAGGDDIVEYYIEAKSVSGKILRWPATAPQLNQTVIVTE